MAEIRRYEAPTSRVVLAVRDMALSGHTMVVLYADHLARVQELEALISTEVELRESWRNHCLKAEAERDSLKVRVNARMSEPEIQCAPICLMALVQDGNVHEYRRKYGMDQCEG